MSGQFRPRGVTMRDCLKNRAGFDRVLMAVAATFLTVSAPRHWRRPIRPAATPLNSRSKLRSRAPNRPMSRPPTINDFKLDSTASAPDAAKQTTTKPQRTTGEGRGAEAPPRSIRAAPDTARPAPQAMPTSVPAPPRPSAASRRARREPVKAASIVAPADQPVADKLREMLGAKAPALFRPQGRTHRGREILHRARIRAAVDARRQP